MNTLLTKNLRYFLSSTTIILVYCFPLLYGCMYYFYTKDLDTLIRYRTTDFIESNLPGFTEEEINIWNTYNEDLQILPYDARQTVDNALNQPFYNRAEGHPVKYRVMYTRICIEDKLYLFMSRIPMIETEDLLGMLVSQYAILFILLLILLGILQKRIARKLWIPFYDSLNKLESFSLEKGIVPVFAQTDIKEFVRLNHQLEEMITNNIKSYNQQKEFIENASHELQTPLAVFQSQLDILLQQEELTEAQVQVIQSLYSVSSRLTRLNKNLLLLARIDNAQFGETEELDFSELLRHQVGYFTDMIENNDLTLEVAIDESLLVVGNKVLLESLINNLLTNAIRHNKPKGCICLEIQDNRCIISNTGKEEGLNQSRIFRRFNRTSEQRKGNGLGLAIAFAICRYHNWQLTYHYQSPYHCFVVDFSQQALTDKELEDKDKE